MNPLTLQTVRGYELRERIGAGGFGEVYRAYQPSVGREVAIKVILPQFANHPDFIRRFETEAQLVARLEHPHIVPLHDYWREPDGAYLVMRYLRGGNLSDSLQQGPWTPQAAARLLDQVAGALNVAHRQEVVHRDIKPKNILLDEDGNAYLSDFGIAKELLRPTGVTGSGEILGSPAYISPEQAKGERLTPQSDLYSLGVVMCQVLTGEHPFPGVTPVEQLMKHLTEPLPSLREQRPDLPEPLEEVIQRATAKDPAARFPDALSFAAAFRQALGVQAPVSGVPVEALEVPAPAPPRKLLPAFLEEGGEETEPPALPVFVAREHELARLDAFLEAALAGQGQIVFVTGGPGRGKTALMHEFARRAMETHPDLLVAAGNCNAFSGLGDPYLPFREVMGMLTGGVEARWVAGAITRDHACRLWEMLPIAAQMLVERGPELVDIFVPGRELVIRAVAAAPGGADWLKRLQKLIGRKEVGSSGVQQSRLFEQYVHVLDGLAAQRPLLIVLDDLQWGDPGSVSLLFHLGRRMGRSRILIAGAYRPEEVALGRDGERHPLEKVLTEFKRRFGDVWVDLTRADESEERRFVDAFLDTEPNRLGEAFRRALFQCTGGHPLFTIELLRAMQGRGDLVQDKDGRWSEGPSLYWERLPARVEAVVEERVGRLEEGLRGILAIASVEGAVFTAEVVAQVQKSDAREMVRRLSNELDKRHRLVSAEGIRQMGSQRLSLYRFRHILFQRYLYGSLDKVERAYLHEDVGSVLEALYGEETEEIAVQLALHFQRAGMAEKAVAYLRQAGGRAVRLSANEEAIAHFTSALALLNTLPETPERDQQELVLQTALFSPLAASKGYGASEMGQAFNRARELSRQMEDSAQLFRVIYGLVGFNMLRAELRTAQELTMQLLRIAQNLEDVDLLLQANRLMGEILYSMGEPGPARTYLAQAITLYDPQLHRSHTFLYGQDVGMSLAIYSAVNLWMLGYSEKAMESSQKALARAKESAHPYSLAYATVFDCIHYILRREPRVAQDKAEAVIALSSKHGFDSLLAFGIILQGWALAEQRQEKGFEQMNQALAMVQTAGAQLWGPGILGLLAQKYMKAGRTEEGLAALAGALRMANENEERWYEAELYRLRGELFVMQGDKTEAEANYHKAIEVARGQGAKLFELRAIVSMCRLWKEQDRSAPARQMLEEIYGWFTEGFDTVDLQEAKALLEELSQENA